MSQLRADVVVTVVAVDAVAVAAVDDGMGVVADAAAMTVDDGAVDVELDVGGDSTAPGCTTAHNEQN